MTLTNRLFLWIIDRVVSRDPDFVIGGTEWPYLLRWWLIPRNRWCNVYMHLFLRSDDDRALHDHPWWWCSLLLGGEYTEHTIDPGGIHHRRVYRTGSLRVHGGQHAHRIELHNGPVWTLFVTGPRYRDWGFHCPAEGWIPWQRFTAADDSGRTGPGCEG